MNKTKDCIINPGQEIFCYQKRNLRELGGYQTQNESVIKPHMIYRGPALSDLSPEEQAVIEDLSFNYILDLRSQQEADKAPDDIPKDVVYIRQCASVFNGEEIDLSPQAFKANTKQSLAAFSHLIKNTLHQTSYNQMVFSNPALKELFSLLEEYKTPLYIHCSAGKDRTGLAALLILIALGVDKEIALDDFELTNRYYAEKIEKALKKHVFLSKVSKSIRQLIQASEGVSRQSAKNALDAILKRYGTFENYFLQEFDLSSQKLEELRSYYTE